MKDITKIYQDGRIVARRLVADISDTDYDEVTKWCAVERISKAELIRSLVMDWVKKTKKRHKGVNPDSCLNRIREKVFK